MGESLTSAKKRIEEFKEIGRDIFVSRLISSHGGNMSLREGDTIYITRSGSMLGRLRDDDIVAVPLYGPSDEDSQASSELVVHRAIYQKTGTTAIVHTHSPHTIFRSMVEEEFIEPIDSEARLFTPRVKIVSSKQTVGSSVAARLISEELAKDPVVVLRGHGPFACGKRLEDAFHWISALECSCEILHLRDSSRLPLIDYLEVGE